VHSTDGWPDGPEGRDDRPDPGGDRVHYDHDGVSVTGQWLTLADKRYAVAELRNLRTVRGPYHPLATATVVVAVAFLFMVGVSWPLIHKDAAAWLGVGAVSIVPLGMALATLRVRPRPYELWADYRGMTGPVYWSQDAHTYGQVCRALIRAREGRRNNGSS